MKATDLTGKRFGKLVVVKYHDSKNGKSIWACKCDCNNITYVRSDRLKDGATRSCGCLRIEQGYKLQRDKYNPNGTFNIQKNAYRNNTSGVRGVSFKKSSGRFWAYIGVRGKTISLGTYETLEEAVEARKKAEERYHQGLEPKHKKIKKKVQPKKTKTKAKTKAKTNRKKSTGTIGVSVSKIGKRDRYRAYIGVKGRLIHLGSFYSLEEAVEARKQAEVRYRNN